MRVENMSGSYNNRHDGSGPCQPMGLEIEIGKAMRQGVEQDSTDCDL